MVSVRYNIGMSNLVSLVRNLQYGAILSFQVLIPRFLRFECLLLFDVNPTYFKTFNADFTVITNLDIYLSLSTSLVLVLLGVQRGLTILLQAGLRIMLQCT